MSDIVVRRAAVEDAPAIARVHIQAWRETYSRLLEPGELDDLDVDARAVRWEQIIADARSTVWVAAIAEKTIGFATAGVRRDHEMPRPIELEAIYVLAAHHGSAAGQRLLDAAIGDSPAFLFVAADNPRAQAFYRRNGFEFDGVMESVPLVRTPIVSSRMVR
ncbi:MAG: GNAT family N-acetyltransferase [Actinomycetota bacterium]|nr:GNAT family N-acetyltransferase [Actinomycetota bacterium]